MNLSDISSVKAILAKYGFSLSHSWGQNFLIDPTVCPRMAELCGADKVSGALEIGPGIGVLTKELAEIANKVVSVEIDKKLIPVLGETLKDYSNVKVINEDITKIDVNELINKEFSEMNVFICANLPYYITSPIITDLLEKKARVCEMTFMVQKEAAIRFCAKPGERECGAVSALINYYSEPQMLFEVPRESFFPAPNVDSAVIKFCIRSKPPVSLLSEEVFFKTVRAVFCQRRKTAVNSLSAGLSLEKNEIKSVLLSLNLSENVRAEALTLENFADISNELYKREMVF